MPINEVHLEGYPEPIFLKGVIHGDELLDELELTKPVRKSSKEYKIWKKNYNNLVCVINRIAGFRRYLTL